MAKLVRNKEWYIHDNYFTIIILKRKLKILIPYTYNSYEAKILKKKNTYKKRQKPNLIHIFLDVLKKNELSSSDQSTFLCPGERGFKG